MYNFSCAGNSCWSLLWSMVTSINNNIISISFLQDVTHSLIWSPFRHGQCRLCFLRDKYLCVITKLPVPDILILINCRQLRLNIFGFLLRTHKCCVVSNYNELWAMFLWISWNVKTRRSKFICVQEWKDECPFVSFITEARWRIVWDTTFKFKLIYYVVSTSRFKQYECVYFYTYTYTINIDRLYITLNWGINKL